MTMMTPIEGITAPRIAARADVAAAYAGTFPATRTTARERGSTDGDDHLANRPLDPDDLEEDFARTAATEGPVFATARRADGWTPDRQRGFLDYLAQGCTVSDAATLVGMSATSAYAFRKRAAGAAFAVGWSAAQLLQRNRLADDLMGRALKGNVDLVINARGETVERHRHDNRLALALLTRLDRIAAAELPDRTGDARAARLAAQDWDRYLDLIGGDASPAQAGLFPSLRSTEGEAAAIAPIVALARADLYRRTGAGHAGEVHVHDLDPARRHEWTAADWARAEAGGLVSLAAPEPAVAEDAHMSQLPQLREEEEPGVWWNTHLDEWRTAFPPPADFDGAEDGAYGDPGYNRELSDDELDAVEMWQAEEIEARRVPEEAERVRFFADLLAGDVGEEASDTPCSGAREKEEDGDTPLPVRSERIEAGPERLPQAGRRRGAPSASVRERGTGEGATPLPYSVRAEPVEALPFSSGLERDTGGDAIPLPHSVRAELVEALPFLSGRERDTGGGAIPLPHSVRAELVEALPFSSSRERDAGGGASPLPQTVRAELVEAPYFVPRAAESEEEGQPFDRLRANEGFGTSVVSPTGPDAEVNSASSDGAVAPPAECASSAFVAGATPWPARITGPDAEVNPASSDGAQAPPAGPALSADAACAAPLPA